MTLPFTAQATYQDGKLQFKERLDLPNNTLVQVLVLPLSSNGKPTLFGLFPQLQAMNDDLVLAKQVLSNSLEHQLNFLSKIA